MKVKKQKKGISLIVLIITIIVMIILASAIIISLSNTGIIDKARKAVDLSNESGIKEALEITVTLLKQEGKLNEENLKAELEKSFEDVEVTKDTDGSYTVGIKDIYFTIEDDKIIKGKYDKWDGTKSEPTSMTDNEIHIYKVSELKWVQEEVAEGNSFEGYTIYLENNLDLGARENVGDTLDAKWKTDENKAVKWTPIGKTQELTLKAKFEGNDYIIKGVYVEDTSKYNGIFGTIENSISNLSIKNSYIEGGICTAGIIGRTDYDVINCHNINTNVTLISGENVTCGGVVGQGKGNIENCTNTGDILAYGISANGWTQVGGIVGISTNVKNCINYGKIYGAGPLAGGITGSNGGKVDKCINYGSISATSYIGGISGNCKIGCSVIDCDNSGTVSGNELYIGGIVGIMNKDTQVKNCINSGNVSGPSLVGGVVGIIQYNPIITNCMNIGNVIGTSEIGGVLGGMNSYAEGYTIKLCYNKGKVTGENNIGSIIGYKEDTTGNTLSNLYYLSSLNLGAINGVDNAEQNVTSTTKDISSFEEFKTWIAQFENN